MNEQQLTAIAKRMRLQESQIKRLVNLLLDILEGKPNSSVEATDYIFIQTQLYKHIKVEADDALELEKKRNELRRKVIEMQLRRYE